MINRLWELTTEEEEENSTVIVFPIIHRGVFPVPAVRSVASEDSDRQMCVFLIAVGFLTN